MRPGTLALYGSVACVILLVNNMSRLTPVPCTEGRREDVSYVWNGNTSGSSGREDGGTRIDGRVTLRCDSFAVMT